MQSGKAQVKEVGGHVAESQKQMFQLVNEKSGISPHEVLQSWLINTVQGLLVKNDKGKRRRGEGLFTFIPLKRRGGGGYLRGGAK